MFLEIVRDGGAGWEWRSIRLVKGKRDAAWWSQRVITSITLNLWRRNDGDRAFLKIGTRIFWKLPNMPLWSHLYDRWSAA